MGDLVIQAQFSASFICAKCGNRKSRARGYCNPCHAAYMRQTGRKHSELATMAKMKQTARCYAGVYQRRGHIKPQPCFTCGDEKAEKHHTDYRKPLQIIWLCRKCHLACHT